LCFEMTKADMSNDEGLFEGTHTLRNVRRDFPEWHLGRSPYVFWGLDVDFPEVRERLGLAGVHLSGLLLDGYCRQPHVTLDLCGFPSSRPKHPDDFGAELVHTQCSALRAAGLSAFEIEVGGLASFSSAPFLKVSDRGGQIAALRQCLAIDGKHRLAGSYVPHVTVGLYADAWPVSEVGPRLADFVAGEPLCCRIERLSLMSYLPSEVGGALNRIADYSLGSGEMRWHCSLPAW
jgi:2'-5' RNA ligase